MKEKGLLKEDSDSDNYYDDFEDEEKNCNNVNNKYLNDEINMIKKFNVYFYFDFNENKKYVWPIIIENFYVAELHIYDLIIYIIKKINRSNFIIKDNNIKYSVSLRDVDGIKEENIDFYVNNYEIKPFDFWTNKDCSIFSPTYSLKLIKEENISFFFEKFIKCIADKAIIIEILFSFV